ncbi:MAG: IclR family transcriptional regulator [Gulosibacter sp.]|uniref:IclR family transcriptional regulator n=1 Tax=Gulosibacter sp. TaxID=2817531 RepID=UPI003F8FF586
MSEQQPTQRVLTSALKCLSTLKAISSSARELTFAEICKSTGHAKATVHQQLQTLVAAELIVKTTGGYRLSLATLALGRAALEQHGVGAGMAASVAALAAKSGEAASIAVREGDFVRLVHRVTIDNSILAGLGAGSLMPLPVSASGTVLLAYDANESEKRSDVETQKLEEVRKQGYAVSVDEYLVGMSTIAIPIVMPTGRVAALSLAAPTFRFDKDRLMTLLTRSRLV